MRRLVVEQTSSDWELILVDDASGDVELACLAKCAAHPQSEPQRVRTVELS